MTALQNALSASQRFAGRFGAVIGLVLVSQILSAISTLVLPFLGLPTADLYAAATQIGLSAFTGVVVGIVYNLAIGRPGFRHWQAWSAVAAVFSIGLALGQFALLSGNGFFTDVSQRDGLLVFVAFGLGGAALSAAGVVGVRRACLGRPRLLAGITVAPNAGLLLAVLALAALQGHVDPAVTHVAPAVVWAASSVGLLLFALRTGPVVDFAVPTTVSRAGGSTGQVAALGLGLITSSVLPAYYMAAVAGLATGVPFALYLTSKLGNSLVALGVNSILVVEYNWVGERREMTRIPEAFSVAGVISAVVALAMRDVDPPVLSYSFVALAWLLLLVPSAIVIREVNARRLSGVLVAKAVVDLVLAAAAAVLLMNRPSVTGYFGAFMVSLGVSIGIGGRGLGSRTLQFLGAASLVIAAAIVVRGW